MAIIIMATYYSAASHTVVIDNVNYVGIQRVNQSEQRSLFGSWMKKIISG